MNDPVFKITPYLLKLIAEASALREWINSSTLKVRWLPALQSEAKTHAAHSSTSIEGNPLTLSQVEGIAHKGPREDMKTSEKEVLNYLKAIKWIEQHSHSSVSERSVLQLHKLITDGLLPAEKCGKYKDKQNYVLDENGFKIYTPPSPKETPKLMAELVEWINSKQAKELHSIITCAILHHRLVSIHPFSDGNGRVARALGTWLLYQRDFDLRHIFSLDEFFAANRNFYYKKIQQARDLDHDLTFWIEYAAEGIVRTLGSVKKRIETLQVSTKTNIVLSSRQEEILRSLRDRGSLSVSDIINELKITRARINQLIQPLVKNGIIKMEGKARATRYLLLAFFVCFLAAQYEFTPPAFAEEAPIFYSEEIVITASRIPQMKNELPASATVITSTEIETLGAKTLGDILKLTYGTFPKTTGSIGSQVSGSIRGASSQQILILIDGQRVNSPLLGGYDLGDILIDDVERIEIVRGPGSALYGADAVGGVINIISKKAPAGDKNALTIYAKIIEMGANDIRLSAAGKQNDIAYTISADQNTSPGDRENSDYSSLKYSGGISKQLTDSFSMGVGFDLYNSKKGVPGSLTFPTTSTRQEDNNQQFRLLSEVKLNEMWTVKMNSSFNNMEQLYSTDPSTSPYDKYRSYSSQYEIQNDIRIDRSNLLNIGAEYRKDQSRSTLSDAHLVSNKALLLQDQYSITDNLSLMGSIRHDEHSVYGITTSPRIGMVYKPDKYGSLWISYGEAYRAPTLNDLYTYYVDPVWGMIMKGNASLRPEKSNSTEIGCAWMAGKDTELSINYFSTRTQDLIQWVDISGTWMTWEAQNVASANICGYEAGLDHQFNDNLKAFINYTGLRAIDDSTGKYLVYRPAEQHNWGIQYNDPSGNSAGILMRHVGERYDNSDNSRNVDAYTVTDIKCGINIAPQMQLELGADNFLNEGYQDTYDYPMPGRIYSFGIKYNMI